MTHKDTKKGSSVFANGKQKNLFLCITRQALIGIGNDELVALAVDVDNLNLVIVFQMLT